MFHSVHFNSKLPFKEVCPDFASRSCQSTFNFLILLFITSLGKNWAEVCPVCFAWVIWCYLLLNSLSWLGQAFGCSIWNDINSWELLMGSILAGSLYWTCFPRCFIRESEGNGELGTRWQNKHPLTLMHGMAWKKTEIYLPKKPFQPILLEGASDGSNPPKQE